VTDHGGSNLERKKEEGTIEIIASEQDTGDDYIIKPAPDECPLNREFCIKSGKKCPFFVSNGFGNEDGILYVVCRAPCNSVVFLNNENGKKPKD